MMVLKVTENSVESDCYLIGLNIYSIKSKFGKVLVSAGKYGQNLHTKFPPTSVLCSPVL